MEKKFVYSEATKKVFLGFILLGIGCLLYALFKRDDMEMGNLVILVYPASTYVLIVLGLAFIGFPLFFYVRSLSKNNRVIAVNKDSFTYPDYTGIKAVTKEIIFNDVDLLWFKNINSKDESIVIY